MELIDFMRFLYRRKVWIMLPVVIGLLIAAIVTKSAPVKYKSSLLVYVQRETQPYSDQYFNYDGYYAIQTSQEYADTVLGLIKSLDVLRRGSEITEYIPSDNQQLAELSSKIDVIKKAPQLIQIDFTSAEREKGKAIVSALAQASRERIRVLNQTGDKALSVGLVNEDPLVIEVKPSLVLNGALGGGLGLVAGLIAAMLIEFIKKNK